MAEDESVDLSSVSPEEKAYLDNPQDSKAFTGWLKYLTNKTFNKMSEDRFGAEEKEEILEEKGKAETTPEQRAVAHIFGTILGDVVNRRFLIIWADKAANPETARKKGFEAEIAKERLSETVKVINEAIKSRGLEVGPEKIIRNLWERDTHKEQVGIANWQLPFSEERETGISQNG